MNTEESTGAKGFLNGPGSPPRRGMEPRPAFLFEALPRRLQISRPLVPYTSYKRLRHDSTALLSSLASEISVIRFLVGALVLSFALATIGCGGNPTATKAETIQLPVPGGNSPAVKDLAEIMNAANQSLKEAKVDQSNPIFIDTAGKIVTHARKYPTDDSTLDGLVMAIGLSMNAPDGEKTRLEAIELIKANFLKSPAIRMHLRTFANAYSDESTDIAREVFKSHPDSLTRAHAAKQLITALEQRARIAKSLNTDTASLANLEKQLGKDSVDKLRDSALMANPEIEGYRTALNKELKGQLPDLHIGALAPETISVDLEGKPVTLSQLKGKIVVLDFWATWCGPCRAMLPHTRKLVKNLENLPFVFVSISVDEEKETVTSFVEKEPMPWTHWWDPKKAAADLWDVGGYPTLYLIDQKGVIQFKSVGYDPRSGKLEQRIEELIEAAAATTKTEK